jgi:mRNA interferase RelE/StbE
LADYILLRQAERYLERMPKNDQIRILEALDTLISDSTKLDIKPLYGRDEHGNIRRFKKAKSKLT